MTGAAELGVPVDEHIAFCLAAMQRNADALGPARERDFVRMGRGEESLARVAGQVQ